MIIPEAITLPEFSGHQLVVDLSQDPIYPVPGFIALHNCSIGPALGGTRIFPYQNSTEALQDALRLSHAMTYKCAVAGLPFGGGKGVIMIDPRNTDVNMEEVLRGYAYHVDRLKGKFYTGEDVGLTESQVQYMLEFSPYFIGKSDLAGDPSKYASLSVFYSIEVATQQVFGTPDLNQRTVAIKGLGKTGSELAWLLSKAGATVYVADIDQIKVTLLQKLCPEVKPTSVNEIDSLKVDIYAPCALGKDITHQNVRSIGAKIICGTANNQLEDDQIAEQLFQLGILHVPDYIANAGGLIDVADELLPGGYQLPRVMKSIERLKKVLQQVLKESMPTKQNPDLFANAMAEKILAAEQAKVAA